MISSRPKVVITHWVDAEVLAFLEQTCEVIANPTRDTLPRSEVLRRAQDAEGLMVFMPDAVDRAFLAACPHLKVIAGALRGYDNFDVQACCDRNIWFTIVPDLLAAPSAELTLGLLINMARQLPAGDKLIRSGEFAGWQPILYSPGLLHRTLGIVGMGKLGQALAQRLVGFEMRVLYTDPIRLPLEKEAQWQLEAVKLEMLLVESDYVVLMVPLQPSTFHLINQQTLAQCKRGCILINPARGSVVDEQAVADALAAGQLAGYGADVFEMEDWARTDRPQSIEPRLLAYCDRTFFTPHLGSAVTTVRHEIAMEAAVNLIQALSGQVPQGAVQPDK